MGTILPLHGDGDVLGIGFVRVHHNVAGENVVLQKHGLLGMAQGIRVGFSGEIWQRDTHFFLTKMGKV